MSNKNSHSDALPWLISTAGKQLFPIAFLTVVNSIWACSGIFFALVCRQVIDYATGRQKKEFIYSIFALIGITVARLAIRSIYQYMQERCRAKYDIYYKNRIISCCLKKDYASIAKWHSGELMNRMTSDVRVISDGLTNLLPEMVAMLVKLVMAGSVLFFMTKWMVAIYLIGGVLIFFVTRSFRGILKRLHKKMQEADGSVRSFLQEVLESLLVIRVFVTEERVKQRSDDLQQEYYRIRMKRIKTSVVVNLGFGMLMHGGYLFALIWCALGLLKGTMSFGTLTAVQQIVSQIQQPFSGLSGLIPQYYSMLASADRLIELESLSDEKEIDGENLDRDQAYGELTCIRFEDITFAYDREMIFDRMNLQVNKGDFVAITGSSGIGKSTMFKLLLSVYTNYEGEINLYADKEKINVDRRARSLFAYVPQGNFLFSGTVRENIAFICPEKPDEEIMQAAKTACADTFIEELPDGLDTVIGERGVGLSEGQIQRLAVARAILGGAPILLLDEATSALDEKTEAELLSNLKALQDKTCMIVTHKKAALDICNKQVYINQGKIEFQ